MGDKVWFDRKAGKVVKSQPEEGTQLTQEHADRLFSGDASAKTVTTDTVKAKK